MKLPISFEETSYFNNGYRRDLIITKGVLYYFRIRGRRRGDESSENLQKTLDEFVAQAKKDFLGFEEDSVPKPMRFSSREIENVKFGLKFSFDAKYDNHDFKLNLIHRNLLKKALHEAGFHK